MISSIIDVVYCIHGRVLETKSRQTSNLQSNKISRLSTSSKNDWGWKIVLWAFFPFNKAARFLDFFLYT